MGYYIRLETEDGEEVKGVVEPDFILREIMEYAPDTSRCLAYLDDYGNTVFNTLQMEPFIREWSGLEKALDDWCEKRPFRGPTGNYRDFLRAVLDMARIAAEEPHHYLRFVGD